MKTAEGTHELVVCNLRRRRDVVEMRFVTPTTPLNLRMVCSAASRSEDEFDLSRQYQVTIFSLDVDRIVTDLPSQKTARPNCQFVIGRNPSYDRGYSYLT